MKKYFTYSLITILCIILADRGIGIMLDYLSKHQKSNIIYETRYKLNKAKPELVILGSSRANHHYNTLAIQKATALKTMNYGMDGTDLFIDYVLISHLLNAPTNNIKTVIVDIKPQELESPPANSYITRLYPFVGEIKEIEENANTYTKYESIKLLSYSYRYNDYLTTLISGYQNSNHDTVPITGFRPINNMQDQNLKKTTLSKKELNQETIEYLWKVVRLCKEKKVQVVVAMSPAYIKNIQEMATYQYLQTFTQQNDIPFLYYGDWKSISKSMYYADCPHLNQLGASIFSEQFALDIKTILIKS